MRVEVKLLLYVHTAVECGRHCTMRQLAQYYFKSGLQVKLIITCLGYDIRKSPQEIKRIRPIY
jgi:hypothetical protein